MVVNCIRDQSSWVEEDENREKTQYGILKPDYSSYWTWYNPITSLFTKLVSSLFTKLVQLYEC